MTRLMSDNPTISAHICLLAQPERNPTLARRTAAAPEESADDSSYKLCRHLQLHMLGYEDMVHVHVQLGPLLLKTASLGNLYRDEVVVVSSVLKSLQYQA